MNEKLHANLMKIHAERSTGIGAGALIFSTDTGRVLVVKRSSSCDSPNTWCCGGGGVEKGETIQQGLKRELMEELGFTDPIKLIHYHRSESPDFVYHNHIGVIDEEFEPKLNSEHTEYKWCNPDQLPEPLHPKFAESLQTPEYVTQMRNLREPAWS
jgi:8-oxo-dGTP pyrophosphatase MutT (NUDIX family)